MEKKKSNHGPALAPAHTQRAGWVLPRFAAAYEEVLTCSPSIIGGDDHAIAVAE